MNETRLRADGPECVRTADAASRQAGTAKGWPPATVANKFFEGEVQGRWTFRITLPYGVDLHWFREAGHGQLLGASALRTGVQGRVEVEAALEGALRVVESEEAGGKRRVKVFRAGEPPAVAARIAGVQPAAASRIGENSLLDALIGAHTIDWVRDALRLVGGIHWKQVAERANARYDTMVRLFEQWQRLTSRQEAALLECAKFPAALELLRELFRQVEEPEFTPEDLTRMLTGVVEENPALVFTPWADCLESCGCLPPGFRQGEASLAALKAAAGPFRRILGDPWLVELLAALFEIAREEILAGEAGAWMQARLKDHGAAQASGPLAGALKELVEKIGAAAPAALGPALPGDWAALLAGADPAVPLVDVTLAGSGDGPGMVERLAGGDLGGILDAGEGARRFGVLTHLFPRRRDVAVRMPFMFRRELRNVAELKGGAAVRTAGDGVIEVETEKPPAGCGKPARNSPAAAILKTAFCVNGDTPQDDLEFLQFTDRRELKAGPTPHLWRQALENFGIKAPAALTEGATASLTVRLAGKHFAGWTRTPHSRDPEFLAVFARISRALQSATREWLPLIYFNEQGCCRPVVAAASMLAYQHTQVYALRRRGEFGYDALDADDVRRALETARRSFPHAVGVLRRRLLAEGDERTAAALEPEKTAALFESVWQRRSYIVDLLVADNRFLEEILQFGECCRELRAMAAHDTRMALRKMANFLPGFVRAFEGRLARLYNGVDFSRLAPLLLIEATRSLPTGVRLPAEARLTIETARGVRVWTEYTQKNGEERGAMGAQQPAPAV